MSTVELSIQLQADSIGAVKTATVAAVADRADNTLWWLMDYSHDITYQNRISGTELVSIDQKINNVDIGSSTFGSWFAMQNSYFSSDQPIPDVTNLKQAIQTFYRWRVSGYFNDIMKGGSADSLDPQYVFPNTDYSLGTYEATSATTGLGTSTNKSGPVDITTIGPGILVVKPTMTIGSNHLALTLTAVYQDSTTVAMSVDVPNGSVPTDSFLIGGQALTSGYTALSDAGVVHVGSTTKFKAGQWVLLREDLTGTTEFEWKTEIAEVDAVNSPTQLTLRQPTPTGATTPFDPGLRNDYTTSASVYPLFIDATVASQASGNIGDIVTIGFDPDRPQGFIDITDISFPQ